MGYSYNELTQPGSVFTLTSEVNGKFFSADGANYRPFRTRDFSVLALFQFIRLAPDSVKIWSVHYKSYSSGFGDMPGGPGNGWPLQPRVEDNRWAEFRVNMNTDGTVTFKLRRPPVIESRPPRDTVTLSVAGPEIFIGETASREHSSWRPVRYTALHEVGLTASDLYQPEETPK